MLKFTYVYLSDPAGDNLIAYKRKAVVVRREVRMVERWIWEKYIDDMEHDHQGRKETAYRIWKDLSKTERKS